jgi:hypothetical protein
LFSKDLIRISLLTLFFLLAALANGQQVSDSATKKVVVDTISFQPSDTLLKKQHKKKKSTLDSPVHYTSVDSMSIVVDSKKVYLYGKGNIKYQKFELNSEYIESDLNTNITYAKGELDTANKYFGKPIFKQGSEEFDSDSIYYNIKSGKGIIYDVVSKQDEGVLHSSMTKRDNQGHIYVQGGKYTTCDAEHPHFYMKLTKAIVVPNDKIITGPAYLVVADIPIKFLGLPFGYFPNTPKKSVAGILIPQFGEDERRGFKLEGFGWYQPLGEYMDLAVQGTWYSMGSWGVKVGSNYDWRYHFGGNMSFDYNVADFDYDKVAPKKDFRWYWAHSQDAKANPTQNFSANVNFTSSGFEKNGTSTQSRENRYNNNKTSSVSYSKNWAGTPFKLGISANASQNTADSTVKLTLPTGSFTVSTIYPFRRKESTGKYKWYENIGFSYNSKFSGNINTKDSLLFNQKTWEKIDADFSHSIPFVINLKSDKIKMLTISPSLSYQGNMKNWYLKKHLEGPINGTQTVVTDTIWKPFYAQAINPSFGIGLSPKITGMFVNTRKNAKLIAVRHIISPSASFSYTPNMNWINPNYYDTLTYLDKNGKLKTETYSYIKNSPSYSGEHGSVSFSLQNNLEAKLKPKNDTTGKAEPKKVALIRNLSLNTSYNPFAENFKWSPVSMSGGTQLFNNVLNINLSSTYNWYDYRQVDTNDNGNPVYGEVDEFYFKTGNGMLRFTGMNISAGIDLRSKQGEDKNKSDKNTQDDQNNSNRNPLNPTEEFDPGYNSGYYVDFDVPWSLNLDYTWRLSRPGLKKDQTISQGLTFRGDFSLTQKWKIGFNGDYDIITHEISTANLSLSRDLHCWTMTFNLIPFGDYKSYTFTIRAKASILSDLKYDKRQRWQDNF